MGVESGSWMLLDRQQRARGLLWMIAKPVAFGGRCRWGMEQGEKRKRVCVCAGAANWEGWDV